MRSDGLHDSEVYKQLEVISLIRQPRAHMLTLREPDRLRDGFFTTAKHVFVGTERAQDVDERPFPCFLSDANVTVLGSCACHGNQFCLMSTEAENTEG